VFGHILQDFRVYHFTVYSTAYVKSQPFSIQQLKLYTYTFRFACENILAIRGIFSEVLDLERLQTVAVTFTVT